MMNLQNENARGQASVGGTFQNTHEQFSPNVLHPVKPVFPDSRFLPGRVLQRLLAGRRLTHKDSWRELGHARLADSIWKLRRLGWPVQMIEETMPTGDGARKANVGIYYLAPELIAAVGEAGQRYAAECARAEDARRCA